MLVEAIRRAKVLLLGLLLSLHVLAQPVENAPPAASAASAHGAASSTPRHSIGHSALAICLRKPPPYPQSALRAQQQGSAVVSFVVGEDGEVRGEQLVKSSGFAILDGAAIKHLIQCKGVAGAQGRDQLAPGRYRFPMVWRLE